MPTVKLTKRTVEKLPVPDPSGKQTLHWDAERHGFGVLCSGTSSAKSWIVQGKLPGGKTRRITLGPTSVLTLEEAWERAKSLSR
jgi:hypothetical protein